MLATQDEAEIRQHDQDEAVQELDAPVAAVGPEQAGADGVRDREADGAPDERAEHAGDGRLAQAAFEEDDERGEGERKTDVSGQPDRQWQKDRGGIGDRGDKQHPRERKPSHGETPVL